MPTRIPESIEEVAETCAIRSECILGSNLRNERLDQSLSFGLYSFVSPNFMKAKFTISRLLISFIPLFVQSAVWGQLPQFDSTRALSILESRLGPTLASKVLSMEGENGQPQPREWRVKIYDPISPLHVREYSVDSARVVEIGESRDYFGSPPSGIVGKSEVAIDSAAAFEILVKQAEVAKIGFDSAQFLLRCQEYSTRAVWVLSAIGEDGSILGQVHISAKTGNVLRTIWIRSTFEKIEIEDSAFQAASRPNVVDPLVPTLPQSPLPGEDPSEMIDPIPPTTRPESEIPEVTPLPDEID